MNLSQRLEFCHKLLSFLKSFVSVLCFNFCPTFQMSIFIYHIHFIYHISSYWFHLPQFIPFFLLIIVHHFHIYHIWSYLCFIFYLGFLLRTLTIHRTAGEGWGYLFDSSLPLPPTSQTFWHKLQDACRVLTSAHS